MGVNCGDGVQILHLGENFRKRDVNFGGINSVDGV